MDTDTLRGKLGLDPAEVPEEGPDAEAFAKALGKVLKRLRVWRGMAQWDVAIALGHRSNTQCHRWETGAVQGSRNGLMTLSTLNNLAALHGLWPSELLALAEKEMQTPGSRGDAP